MYKLNLALFGKENATSKNIAEGSNAAVKVQQVNLDKEQVAEHVVIDLKKANTLLEAYKKGKENIQGRVKENEQWYKIRHWDYIKKGNKGENEQTESRSAWLFNSIFSKHSDMMDNYPEANILPREKDDLQEADKLASIIPLIFDNTDFEGTYSENVWEKLKHGTGIYGVFWDSHAENGLGDITITNIDLFSIFWEPGIKDIQDSKNLFIVALEDKESIEKQYNIDNLQTGNNIEIEKFVLEDEVNTTDKVLVVDWYFKSINEAGKSILNYVKYVGETVLYNSMEDAEQPNYATDGYYGHGLYPVVFDVLFPLKGTPAGFGLIDICKDDQLHIDKLDSVILQNAYEQGIQRWFNMEGSGVNKEQFADFSNRFVDVKGNPEQSLRAMESRSLPAFIINQRQAKIDEIKETTSNRDVSQGSSSGGVTAAAAISALQEAGNKNSRDMIKGSYRAYTKICKLVIELIRQFYSLPRQFRIMGKNGQMNFVEYDNTNLQARPMPMIQGQAEQLFKQSYFDVKVKAQRANPYARVSQNELASNLFSMGAFNPQNATQIIPMLEMMEFEGKDKVLEQVMQGQTQQRIIEALQTFIEQTTGVPIAQILANQTAAERQPTGKPIYNQEQNKSYGERIADRAKPTVEGE